MSLSDFITRHMEEILVEWEVFARTLGPAADTMDVEALRDHAQEMLTAIAADLSRLQSPAQQEAKSKGEAEPPRRAGPPPPPTTAPSAPSAASPSCR